MKFRDYTKYDVFEDGRIYSYKSKKFLKPATLPNGYQQVALSDNEGKIKRYYVHRVVYEAVSGEPIPEGFEVNHRNEDKTDNRFFENLNLLTHKENMNFGTRNERAGKANSNNPKRSKAISKSMTNNPKLSKAVGAFKNDELIMVFPSIAEARRNGFSQANIWACCNNCYMREGNNIYRGYTWKYI